MIFAEKIMMLRKQNGWSQEDLAEQMNISRQSVSKWESGASIPDLDKILKMSELFGVSTDYLLKDELEEVTYAEGKEPEVQKENTRSVSLDEANAYMKLTGRLAPRTALAICGCIVSPVVLILLGGLSEYNGFLSEDMAAGIGIAILLLLIAPCAGVIIYNSLKLEKYEYLEKEILSLQYGVAGIVEMKKNNYEPTYHKKLISGIILCILSVLPLMLGGAFGADDFTLTCFVALLLFIVSIGSYLIISSSTINDSFAVLLQTGDYLPEQKNQKERYRWFSGAYWCIMTAVYLGISFYTNHWHVSWIIWPVAGLIYAALWLIISRNSGSRK